MIYLKAKNRKETGKIKTLRNSGEIPAVVYGYNISENDLISVNEKEFKKVFKEAGESSLIELQIDEKQGKRTVLIHDMQKDPVSSHVIHIDFFQPNLKEEVQVAIPLVFEGVAPAEKDLGGTLVKNMLEIEVKALPQNLPGEIKINIDSLKTFEDHILVKDLVLPKEVEILKRLDEIVVSVLPPQDIEAELAKEIKGDVEDIQKVEKEKKEEEIIEEVESKPAEPSK